MGLIMILEKQEFKVHGLNYIVRSAIDKDARELSELRLQIDGETENLDRVRGEGIIDPAGFEHIIKADTENSKNLFLVAVVGDRVVGFSRCEGNHLSRYIHKAEFGVCVIKDFWGYHIEKNLLKETISWADSTGLTKMSLNVLETNHKAIQLYQSLGFEVEGLLKNDKILSDGKYYNTIVMGRFTDV